MCRFAAYLGKPIIIDELLIKPENSLVNQSYDAEEMAEPLNGDGFGLGWYAKHIRKNPGLFRSISPAWNNQNLLYNASLIQTNCLFAHIRAATEGGISEFNCHPFHYEEFLMMHNGGIEQFPKIKRQLIGRLSDEAYLWIKGQTDSEHLFALLMDHLFALRRKYQRHLKAEEVARAFEQTFRIVQRLMEEAGIAGENAHFNMMITDGERLFGTRYSSYPAKGAPTLYYATGTHYSCTDDGMSRMREKAGEDRGAVLIVSEKLTEHSKDWIPIPENHFIAVEKDLTVDLLPLD